MASALFFLIYYFILVYFMLFFKDINAARVLCRAYLKRDLPVQ